jgi:uncharacterized membrane protein HdeD (DUF308 family)
MKKSLFFITTLSILISSCSVVKKNGYYQSRKYKPGKKIASVFHAKKTKHKSLIYLDSTRSSDAVQTAYKPLVKSPVLTSCSTPSTSKNQGIEIINTNPRLYKEKNVRYPKSKKQVRDNSQKLVPLKLIEKNKSNTPIHKDYKRKPPLMKTGTVVLLSGLVLMVIAFIIAVNSPFTILATYVYSIGVLAAPVGLIMVIIGAFRELNRRPKRGSKALKASLVLLIIGAILFAVSSNPWIAFLDLWAYAFSNSIANLLYRRNIKKMKF